MAKPKATKVVYVRLFTSDVEAIRKYADAKGAQFQTELRLVVHEAVTNRQRGNAVVR